jgi:hypothetical protein
MHVVVQGLAGVQSRIYIAGACEFTFHAASDKVGFSS